MSQKPAPELDMAFPCDHVFKVFGVNDGEGRFLGHVRSAVETVGPVCLDAFKVRPSRLGTYQCVSLVVRVHSMEQLNRIYIALKKVPDLKYLL